MIEEGVLKGYDYINHRANLQLVVSLTTYLDNIKVARNILAADMVIGRRLFVCIPDNNPKNAAVIAVFDP